MYFYEPLDDFVFIFSNFKHRFDIKRSSVLLQLQLHHHRLLK